MQRHGLCFGLDVLAWIAGGWLAGLFSGAQGQTRVGPLLAALALTVALSILLHGRELEAKLWVAPLSLLAFCCGLAVSQPQPPRCSTRGRASVLVRVVRVRHGPDHARLRLVTVAGRQQSSGQRIPKGTWIETRIENRLAPPRGSLVRFETDIGPQT
ncbi:MAG: hypothetical protein PVH76_11980, partial [Myxococcales bacterium]